MVWHKVAEPSVNFKSVKGGDRGTISVSTDRPTKYAYIVEPDYERREYIIWFQNFINEHGEVDGDKTIRLPWKESDPWAFAAWNHQGTLKIAFKHWGSDKAAKGTYGVYNTGYYSED